MKKFSNLIGACLSAALFAACGGSGLSSLQFPSNPMLRAPKDLGARKCPPHCIYVAQPRLGRQSPDEILFFSRLADGNTPPVASIAGSKTAMGYVEGVAMDSRGDLYVTNGASNTITVYASGSQGNVAPIRTIGGPKTQLNLPQSLALDGSDDLYVANIGQLSCACPSVTVYPPRANGNVKPTRAITGAKTEMNEPYGVAPDASENIYVVNSSGLPSIRVYAADANGNVAPIRTIAGRKTQLSGPNAIALDSTGYIYVTNLNTYTIAVFRPGAKGDAAPVRLLDNGVVGPEGVALDENGKIYVTNVGFDSGSPSVTVYAAGANGHAAPLRTIVGRKTKVYFPIGILVR